MAHHLPRPRVVHPNAHRLLVSIGIVLVSLLALYDAVGQETVAALSVAVNMIWVWMAD